MHQSPDREIKTPCGRRRTNVHATIKAVVTTDPSNVGYVRKADCCRYETTSLFREKADIKSRIVGRHIRVGLKFDSLRCNQRLAIQDQLGDRFFWVGRGLTLRSRPFNNDLGKTGRSSPSQRAASVCCKPFSMCLRNISDAKSALRASAASNICLCSTIASSPR